MPLTPHVGTRSVVATPDGWRPDHPTAPLRLVRCEAEPDPGLTAHGVRRQAEGGTAGFRLAEG